MIRFVRAAVVVPLALGIALVCMPLARAEPNDDLRAAKRLAADGRWSAAESLATSALRQLEGRARPDSLLLADALARVAEARLNQRRLRDSTAARYAVRAIGIRARNRPGPDPAQVALEMLTARILNASNRSAEAMALTRDAIGHGRSLGAPAESLTAEAFAVQGRAALALSRWPESAAAFDSAIAIESRRPGCDSTVIASFLTDQGATFLEAGQPQRSRDALTRAIGLLERAPNSQPRILAIAYGNLAGLERQAGRLAEAVELSRRSYETQRRAFGERSLVVAQTQANLAFQLIALDDVTGAQPLLTAAIPTLVSNLGRTHRYVVRARTALANSSLTLGDTLAATAQLDTVDALYAGASPPPPGEHAYALTLRAGLLAARGRTLEARRAYEGVLASLEDGSDPTGAKRADVHSVVMETFRTPADTAAFDSTAAAVARVERTTVMGGTPSALSLLTARAAAERRIGRTGAAWNDALLAEARARETFLQNVRVLPDRRALGLQARLAEPMDLLVAWSAGRGAADVATAWDRLVRWRGLAREEVAARRPPLGAASDSARVRLHDAWVAAQRAYAERVVDADPGPAGQQALQAARVEAEEAERRLRRVAPSSGAPDSVTLDRVIAHLAPGEALVAFAEYGEGEPDRRLAAFVATARHPAPVRLEMGPVEPLRAIVETWRARLSASPRQDPRGIAAAERDARRAGELVRARVWEPVRRAAGDAAVLHVVGDGPVADVPWLALPEPSGRWLAESAVQVHELGAERELLHASSAPGSGLLAVGDPDFGAVPGRPNAAAPLALANRSSAPCERTRPFALAPLPAAREEAIGIASTWPRRDGAARTLLGGEATEQAFLREAPGRLVLHVATHGVVVEDSCAGAAAGARGVGGVQALGIAGRSTPRAKPARASAEAAPPAPKSAKPRQVWLAFAGAGASTPADSANDGLLTAEEVATLDLRGTDWVVLSACHSAAGEAWPHEGALGMRRAFQMAGARSVFASQWSVDDAATREWMTALYAARLAGTTGASEAAREACRAVLDARRRDGRSTHPFYWAAFTASGE